MPLNSHTFNVYQLLDGNIVVPGNIITISINDGKVKNCLYDFELLDDVKLDYKIGVRKAIRIARGVARGNKDSMLVNPFGMKGEAYLEYYFGSLYYKVIINDYSYVCVDANTGEVLDSFFHDGVVY